MNTKIQATIFLVLNSVCCYEVFSQSDTINLSKAPIINSNLSVEDHFPDTNGSLNTEVLWIQKLSDGSRNDSPVIFKSKVLVANSSKCYDLFSGKPMDLQSDSSKQAFPKSFIQIPFKGLSKLYSQGKLIGTYGDVQPKIAAYNSERAFGIGDYKILCIDTRGSEVWSIMHPKRVASEVWLNDNFILALRSFSLSLKKNDKELIVLDYDGNIQTIVDELEGTPNMIIQKDGLLYVGSSSEIFALDVKRKKIIWRIDQMIEQNFSLHKDRLVSASVLLDPKNGTVLEKYPMGVHGEWKMWNSHFVTRVFDGDEYNDFLCEESPRKYYYLNYQDLRSYEMFKSISLTANYPNESTGDTTAAIFKGSDGFYLVGLKMHLPR